MPNDAKLGLVAGVAIVIVVAVVFFRKEPGSSAPRAAEAAAAAVGANSVPSAPLHRMSPSPNVEAAEEGKLTSRHSIDSP